MRRLTISPGPDREVRYASLVSSEVAQVIKFLKEYSPLLVGVFVIFYFYKVRPVYEVLLAWDFPIAWLGAVAMFIFVGRGFWRAWKKTAR